MKLKTIIYIFVLFLCLGCQNQYNQYVDRFEEILGERETEALNLLVSDFETNLEKIYPDLSQQLAYEHYLKDIIDPTEGNWKKFKFQTDKTHNEFINSGLRTEIYISSKVYDDIKEDSILVNEVNQTGKYMRALYTARALDTLIDVSWDKRDAAGLMQNELVVKGLLYYKPDFNNYFHKRIVVVEFSY